VSVGGGATRLSSSHFTGKATVTATFSAPGEYVVRGQVNDASGDGGGGDQCCWMNVHGKASVRAAADAK